MLVLAATPQLEAGKLHMKLEYFAAAGSAMTRSVVVLALMPTEAPTPVPNAAAHGRFWWAVLAPPNVHAWLSWCHAGSNVFDLGGILPAAHARLERFFTPTSNANVPRRNTWIDDLTS